jgi:SAM-dependent methyltransferase
MSLWDEGRSQAIEVLTTPIVRNGEKLRSGLVIGNSGQATTVLRARCEKLLGIDPKFAQRYLAEHSAEFDLVANFDLLEFAENDQAEIDQMVRSLRPGGYLLITASAGRSLWSSADVFARRFRRYEREELVGKVEKAGLTLERATCFFTTSYPVVRIFRKMRDFFGKESSPTPEIPNILIPWVERSIRWEVDQLRKKDLQFGTSIFCIAKKNN